jgi:hypothetical protein
MQTQIVPEQVLKISIPMTDTFDGISGKIIVLSSTRLDQKRPE